MADGLRVARIDGHADNETRERWGGAELHRGGVAGVDRGRGRAEATREGAAREAGEEEDDGEVAGLGDPWARLVVRMGPGQCYRARRRRRGGHGGGIGRRRGRARAGHGSWRRGSRCVGAPYLWRRRGGEKREEEEP